MTKKPFVQALAKFFSGFMIILLILFVPAGTLSFRNGWIFMGILFVPMFIAGIVMMFVSPALLEKRLNVREQEDEQKKVVAMSGLMFLAAFVTAGLNYRFSWIAVPDAAVYIAVGVFLAAYVMYAEVLRENAYLSRTVEVRKDQKVVDTGLYGAVRHPMYSATLLLFLSMGIVLGSPISFAILLLYIPIIAKRIKNEEEVLTRDLNGYDEYKKKVKYRLIPFIW